MYSKNFTFNFCILSIFLYILLGNIATFNLGNRLPIKIGEILLFISILLIMFFYRFRVIYILKYFNLYIIWIILGIVSGLLILLRTSLPIKEFIYGLLYPIRLIFIIFCSYIIALFINLRSIKYKRVIDYILIAFVVVSIFGFVQLIMWPIAYDFYDLLYSFGVYWPNPDPHINRLFSTYLDPNYLASILNVPLIISLSLFFYTKRKKYIFYCLILIISLILTVSRSGFLCIALTVCFYFILSINFYKSNITINKSIFRITMFFIILGIGFLFSNGRLLNRIINVFSDPSANARFKSWINGLYIIKDNLFIGIGNNLIGAYRTLILNQNVNASAGYGNDSSLIFVFITTGLIGLIIYLSSFISLFKELGHLCKNENKIIKNTIISITLSSIAVSFFNNLLFYPLWLFIYTFFVNLTLIYLKSGKKLIE